MTTVPASTRTTTITLGSASAGPFLVGFRIFDAGLDVYVNDVLRTDYTVSATFTNGFTDTASITFTAALPLGSVIRIDGDMPIARGAQYVNPDPNLTAKLNIELGRVWSGMQQLERDRSRGLRSTAPIDPIVPGPVGTALIRTATGYGTGPNAADIAGAQGYAADALVASTAAQAQAAILAGILAFGAVAGGPAAANQTALTSALTSAAGRAVLVPSAASAFDFTGLTAAQRKLIYGDGLVTVGGVATGISSAPFIASDTAYHRVFDTDWQPSKWSSVDGSLYNGAFAADLRRTGGWGTYGANLTSLTVNTNSTGNQFDVGVTSWAAHSQMNGGNIFGMWSGAVSPHKDIGGHTWTDGLVVGMEINSGNRFVELGLQTDIGNGLRQVIGLQVVPDLIPNTHGANPAEIFHGSFGMGVSASIHGHKWWTGYIQRADSIVPGGIGMKLRGGSVLGNAPSTGLLLDGFYTNGVNVGGTTTNALVASGVAVNGLNLSAGTFSGAAALLAAGQRIDWGGASISGGAAGISISIGNGGSISAANDFHLYTANFTRRALRAGDTGTAAAIGFLGAAPITRVTLPPAATDLASAITLLNAMRLKDINFGFAD